MSAQQPFSRNSVVVLEQPMPVEPSNATPPGLAPQSHHHHRRSSAPATEDVLSGVGKTTTDVRLGDQDVLERMVPLDRPAPSHLQPLTPERAAPALSSQGASTTPPTRLSPLEEVSPIPLRAGSEHEPQQPQQPSLSPLMGRKPVLRAPLLAMDLSGDAAETTSTPPSPSQVCVGNWALVRRRMSVPDPLSSEGNPGTTPDANAPGKEEEGKEALPLLSPQVQLTPGKIRRRASAAVPSDNGDSTGEC